LKLREGFEWIVVAALFARNCTFPITEKNE